MEESSPHVVKPADPAVLKRIFNKVGRLWFAFIMKKGVYRHSRALEFEAPILSRVF